MTVRGRDKYPAVPHSNGWPAGRTGENSNLDFFLSTVRYHPAGCASLPVATGGDHP
jgi:hypothetical protein